MEEVLFATLTTGYYGLKTSVALRHARWKAGSRVTRSSGGLNDISL